MMLHTRSVLLNAYEGLVGLDPQMAIVPGLAVSWTSPEDDLWEFRLRPAPFHTGDRLTAGDVAFSLERARSHPSSSLRAALATVASVEAPEPLLVRVRMREPDVSLLHRLRDVGILSKRFVEERGEAALQGVSAGTGPYRLRPGKDASIELQRFDDYWGGRAKLPAARFLAMAYGDPSLAASLPAGAPIVFYARPGTALFLRARQEATAHRWAKAGMSYLAFDLRNTDSPGVRLPGGGRGNPFLDLRVREAVALAIDYDRLRKQTLDGEGIKPTQAVAPFVFGFDPKLPEIGPDLEGARRKLAAAGHAAGFEVDLDVRALMAEYGPPLADNLARLGIRATVRTLDDAAFFERLGAARSSLYVLRFSCRTGDAQEFFDAWVHSLDTARGLGTANFSYAKSPVGGLDAEIEQARRDFDVNLRRERLRAINRRIMEALLLVPLQAPMGMTFVSPSLAWTPRNDGFWLVRDFEPKS